MNITELITQLEALREKYGDCEVVTQDYGFPLCNVSFEDIWRQTRGKNSPRTLENVIVVS